MTGAHHDADERLINTFAMSIEHLKQQNFVRLMHEEISYEEYLAENAEHQRLAALARAWLEGYRSGG